MVDEIKKEAIRRDLILTCDNQLVGTVENVHVDDNGVNGYIKLTEYGKTFFGEARGLPFKPLSIVKVIFNDPATIVFWSDGTKTIVKTVNGDKFDYEKGLAMAIVKKSYGNSGSYYDELKKWLPKDDEE